LFEGYELNKYKKGGSAKLIPLLLTDIQLGFTQYTEMKLYFDFADYDTIKKYFIIKTERDFWNKFISSFKLL